MLIALAHALIALALLNSIKKLHRLIYQETVLRLVVTIQSNSFNNSGFSGHAENWFYFV